MPIGIILPMIA